MNRRLRAATAVAGALLLAACAPTTYDSSVATTDAPATSSTLPTGTVADLLPLMLTEVEGLSAKVMAGQGDGEAADRIEQYWAAIQAEVAADHPEMVEDFEFVVSRCRLAADRNRPADADRAAQNMAALVNAYLG
ncbi:MAG: hypothetical protein KDB06_09565 [Ilumatobacter sp.]|nr:hypothetical protein [Ilumatobacter sp.]MCB0984881.1 hypothetical protein [Ilumatobacter sp.]